MSMVGLVSELVSESVRPTGSYRPIVSYPSPFQSPASGTVPGAASTTSRSANFVSFVLAR